MLASQTPRLGQPSGAIFRPRRCTNPAARWLVAFGAILFLLVTLEPSHACGNRIDPAPDALQQVVTHVTKRQIVSSQVAAVISNRPACCGDQSHHRGGAQAGSCCAACTAGLFVTSYAFFRTFPPCADFVLPNINFSPAPLDEQFRPPRTAL
jgi:hypothetical protein